MSEWIPTKLGWYLLDGHRVHPSKDDTGVYLTDAHMNRLPMALTGWSLLAPEWQAGVPTAEQLDRWRRWAIDKGRELHCAEWSPCGGGQGIMTPCGTVAWNEPTPFCPVTRSAPIQPDWSAGPRWVPLEVAS